MLTPPSNPHVRQNRAARLQPGYACLRGRPLTSANPRKDNRTANHRPSKWIVARIMLALLLSCMPILAISAHVFGLVSERTSALVLVVPLATALATIVTVSPHRIDGIFGRGLVAGMVACLVYDAFRLFAVHVLGWMGDFIPVMGTWVTGDPDKTADPVVGYLWRYLGDAGGLGVAFYVVALAVGLDRLAGRPHRVVLAAVGYAVFPVWTGLIATVALAPRGQELTFHLTPAAIATTLIGHLIFGFVLGLCFVGARRGWDARHWPWSPLRVENAWVKPRLAFAR